jgi:tetratricopeptide (TPR) repeat protein
VRLSEVRLADSVPEAWEAKSSGEWQSLAEILGVELDRIDRMAEVAWRLYDSRSYREAAAIFRGLRQLDPENIDLYRGYALAASKDHDLVAAVEALDQALLLLDGKDEREQDRAQLLALRATFLYRSGRKKEAVESAQASLKRAPSAPWADALRRGLQRASQSAARRKGKEEARGMQAQVRERLKTVLEGTRSLAWAIGYGDSELLHVFHNGAALLDAGHAVRARRIFEGLVALDADVPLFHLALGAAWEAVDDFRKASAAYDDAVDAARDVDDGDDLLADALLRRGRYHARRDAMALAQRDLDEALALGADAMTEELRARARSLRDGLTKATAEAGAGA